MCEMADLDRACFDRVKKLLVELGDAVEAVACLLVAFTIGKRTASATRKLSAIMHSFKATSTGHTQVPSEREVKPISITVGSRIPLGSTAADPALARSDTSR